MSESITASIQYSLWTELLQSTSKFICTELSTFPGGFIMNRRTTVLTSFLLIFSLFVAPLGAAEYSIDPDHTSVVFKVKHMDIAYIYGMFNNKEGTVQYDPKAPEKTSIDLTVDATSVFTGVKKRDNHLRSPDFLNAKQHPEITFRSTSVQQNDDNVLEVTGDFTLRGVTRELTTDVKLTGSGKGPQGNFRRGFKTSFDVNRLEHNVDYMPDGLGKSIKITVSGEVIRQ